VRMRARRTGVAVTGSDPPIWNSLHTHTGGGAGAAAPRLGGWRLVADNNSQDLHPATSYRTTASIHAGAGQVLVSRPTLLTCMKGSSHLLPSSVHHIYCLFITSAAVTPGTRGTHLQAVVLSARKHRCTAMPQSAAMATW
jgi:hypothetical protein